MTRRREIVQPDESMPKSRAEAKAMDSPFYFTGKPCKHGHVSVRRTRNGHCIECAVLLQETPEYREYMREYSRQYQAAQDHKDSRRVRNRKRESTPERKEYERAYRAKPERREYARSTARQRQATPEYREYARNKARQRRKEDPSFRLRHNISTAVSRSLKLGKGGKKTFELLGYTREELMRHIEKRFKPGMSWDNYGEWHLDHKIPLSVHNFETPDDPDFKAAWALSNLQPLWAKDNTSKQAKLEKPFQPSLLLRP